ncbi:MAG TPA: DUF6691 family protein [Bdellovibrionales bacterium]|nr:DUF6691 family protein [Bdellovibrionales bacterium]
MTRQVATAFVTGFIFAIGLAIAGMTQPQKILGFLNLAGNWDPSLMFVMAGAIPVHWISYRLIKGRKSPLFDVKWHLPEENKRVDFALMFGALVFGVGWGLSGYCPGPALASLASAELDVAIFVAMMTGGMFLGRWVSAGPSRSD